MHSDAPRKGATLNGAVRPAHNGARHAQPVHTEDADTDWALWRQTG